MIGTKLYKNTVISAAARNTTVGRTINGRTITVKPLSCSGGSVGAEKQPLRDTLIERKQPEFNEADSHD